MHISLLANDLHCRHCNKPNSADRWPLQGDRVGFVFKEEPGQHSLEIYCHRLSLSEDFPSPIIPGTLRVGGKIQDSGMGDSGVQLITHVENERCPASMIAGQPVVKNAAA